MNDDQPTVDGYLAALPEDKRRTLEAMRALIGAQVPQAEEEMSYGVPAFKLKGKALVGYGASAEHCAIYTMSGSTLDAFKKETAGFDTSKGTIRFSPAHPLPEDLVRKLVRARLKEVAGSSKK